MKMRIFGVILVISLISISNALKILMLLPFPGPSHYFMFKVYIDRLISRGHEVTCISAFEYGENRENYTEVLIEPRWSFGETFSQAHIYNMKFQGKINMLYAYWGMGLSSTEHALKTQNVRNFIKNDNTKFDVIFAEQFFQESMLMFSHKYQAPIVTLSTYGYSDFMDNAMGLITPYSFVPHMVLHDYSDQMSIYERAYNFVFSMYDALMRKYYYFPAMDKMARENFPDLPQPLPMVAELEKSISVILVNSKFGIAHPRPLMPGMVNVGGSHIKPIKPLPADIKKFMDEAVDGVIFFSLGSFLQSQEMPKEKMKMILKVFGSLKQRVLWKFEADKIEDLPSNVMIKKWMPQTDILAHRNIRLFISHGGLFGTIEGSYFGVPILFMPFYGDQFRNAKLIEGKGFGDRIMFSDISENSFKNKLDEVLRNENYRKNAKKMSEMFNDNLISPLDEAIYWIEYAAKFNGAKHLKSPAVNLPWFKYLGLDIIALISIFLYIFIKLLKVTYQTIFGKSTAKVYQNGKSKKFK